MSDSDSAADKKSSRQLSAPVKILVGVAAYFLAFVLWGNLLYWVKLRFLVGSLSPSEELAVRSWSALEVAHIPALALLLIPAHLLVLLARLVVGAGLGSSVRLILFASLVASAMMLTLFVLTPPMHWIISLVAFGLVTSYTATRVCYGPLLRGSASGSNF